MRNRFLITLYRQGLFELDTEQSNIQLLSEDYTFFSTDYFDKMIIKPIDNDAGMAEFLGMRKDVPITDDVIAIQNYAIYTDRYDNIDFNSFFNLDTGLPYLSMIHVYITADALAGIDIKNDNSNISYIDYFEKDLVGITSEFENNNIKVFVFKMLSASDFMVLVRSKRPEQAFAVSTRIRKQLISKKGQQDNEKECLVLYKTYTILTIQGQDILFEEDDTNNNVFAIRGRFSNRYWSDDGASTVSCQGRIKMLNGHYDFLVHISIDEFQALLPQLWKCKKIGEYTDQYTSDKDELSVISDKSHAEKEMGEDTHYMPEHNYSQEYEYLRKLLEKGYLSYVNERYLLAISSDANEGKNFINELHLKDDFIVSPFMYSLLNDKCKNILKKIDGIDNQGILFKCQQKWPQNSMMLASIELLKRLVNMCRNVNSLSDTRVYVVALLNQLETVIDAIDEWLNVADDDSQDFSSYMEMYTRTAIVALEKYAGLIRSNNFQTLQAPSYDIISGCSIEKILIAYGKFMSIMMDYALAELPGNTFSKFVPIMVPDISSDSPKVQICYKEYVKDGKPSNVINNMKIPKYLMIVSGPITDKLVEGWNIITILFHEMAHNFRFEERMTRNEVIARMMIETAVHGIVECLFDSVSSIEPAMVNEKDYMDIFEKIIIKIFIEQTIYKPVKDTDIDEDGLNNKKQKEYKEFMDYPLDTFQIHFKKELNSMFECIISKQATLRNSFLHFFNITSEYISQDMLEIIGEILDKIDTLLATDGKKLSKEAVAYSREIETLLDKYVKGYITNLGTENSEVKESNLRVARNISQELAVTDLLEQKVNFDKEIIMRQIFVALKDKLDTVYILKNNSTGDMLSELSIEDKDAIRMMRLFGLDEDLQGNQEHFNDLFVKAVSVFMYEDNDSMGKKFVDQYREETADLFMCTMCDLDLQSYMVLLAGVLPRDSWGYQIAAVERICHNVIIRWGITEGKYNVNNDIVDVDWEEVDNKLLKEFIGIYKLLEDKDEDILVKDMSDLMNYTNDFLIAHKHEISMRTGLATLLFELLQNYRKCKDALRIRAYLTADYLRGTEHYIKLRQKFVDSNDPLLKIIKEMCEMNKKYLYNYFEVTDVEAEYHKKFEDFIMTMYCHDKLYYAEKGRGICADKNI